MVVASFVIALTSLVVAVLSAGWQIYSWVLDGRRVRLALVDGVVGQGGAAVGTVERNREPRALDRLREQGFTGPEVLGVSVTNVGRATVRIDQYAVELVSGGVALVPHGNIIGPALPYRLPAGESETWYVEASEARALVYATKGVQQNTSDDVRMTIQLGTGETKRAKRDATARLEEMSIGRYLDGDRADEPGSEFKPVQLARSRDER